MASIFDKVIDRDPKYSFKWNRYRGQDVIPCWVADMDFAAPPSVQHALQDFNQQGVLGYLKPEEFDEGAEAIVNWLEYRHGFRVPQEWIVWMPGVVPGFNISCRAFSEAGQGLIVQTPNYPPILHAHKNHLLEHYPVPVVQTNEGPDLDYEQLERAAAQDNCRVMILCNPMNPNGKVLSPERLQYIASICEENNVILISDEIHCDLILDPTVRHTPAYSVDGLQERSVTLMSAAKTFNIAGLGVSFGIIPSPKLRRLYLRAANGLSPWANVLGLVATAAAFNGARQWREELISYLRTNRDFLHQSVNNVPGLSFDKSEATFLAWLDARGLGLENPQAWFEGRGVGPSPGSDFAGPGFARINFACSMEQLEQIAHRITTG